MSWTGDDGIPSPNSGCASRLAHCLSRSGDMDAGPSVLDMLEVSLQEERVLLEMVGRDPRARCLESSKS